MWNSGSLWQEGRRSDGERSLSGFDYIYMACLPRLSGRDRVFYCIVMYTFSYVLEIYHITFQIKRITFSIKLTVLLKNHKCLPTNLFSSLSHETLRGTS